MESNQYLYFHKVLEKNQNLKVSIYFTCPFLIKNKQKLIKTLQIPVHNKKNI